MSVIRLTPAQRRVYKLLREGCAQSQVVQTTRLPKGTVSRIASKLVERGFLIRITDVQPYLYGEGARSKELDLLIASESVSTSSSDEVSRYATSVKQVPPRNRSVATVRAHHVKVRFLVEKIGDMEYLQIREDGNLIKLPFLEPRPYLNRRNVSRRKGKILVNAETFSVELEETSGHTYLYLHLPELNLTVEQLDEWEELYAAKAQQVANFIQKWGHWRFGLMEFCARWKPHFATEDPRILQQIVGKATAKSSTGHTWLSDSEGRRELETDTPRIATAIVQLPEKVVQMEVRIDHLIKILEMIVKAQELEAQIELSNIEKDTVLKGILGGK